MAHKKPHRKLSVLFETADAKLLHDLASFLGTSVNDILRGCAEPLLRALRPRPEKSENDAAGGQ